MNESARVSETAAGELCASLEAQLTIFSSSFVCWLWWPGPWPLHPLLMVLFDLCCSFWRFLWRNCCLSGCCCCTNLEVDHQVVHYLPLVCFGICWGCSWFHLYSWTSFWYSIGWDYNPEAGGYSSLYPSVSSFPFPFPFPLPFVSSLPVCLFPFGDGAPNEWRQVGSNNVQHARISRQGTRRS